MYLNLLYIEILLKELMKSFNILKITNINSDIVGNFLNNFIKFIE